MLYGCRIIDGGYEILINDKVIIKQIVYPNRPELGSIDNTTAEQMAKLILFKLDNDLSPFITLEEEIELSSGIVEYTRILDMVNSWAIK